MSQNKNEQQLLYIKKINKVVAYIYHHLDDDLSLKKLADVACFSPFHFHRIFSALIGETPNQYISRRRIEKIANALLLGDGPESLTVLAHQYGFKSIHSFSRAFKNFYGMSASEFQKRGRFEFSKIGKTESKNGEHQISFEKYFYTIENLKNWLTMRTEVKVKEMPKLQMVDIRHRGPYPKIGEAFQKLMGWAGPRGLLNFPKTKMVAIYYDSPRITDENKMESSACVTIEEDVEVNGEVGKVTIPKGKFAVGSFKLKYDEFEKAWNSMSLWVPEHGFELRDGHYHEIYHNDGTQDPEGLFIVDICIPIQ
ncbi:AraC family transcriptional regulator [Flagellimonas allohymeniacidonis]|uniref:AraC family transcriptional regulator n=1 Tax=Flagellimonas allohymeniacidonis TaxID=2517819 RepID=A0A4Q8QD83_9FLAO|nr:AraC family transcriptional regulator [Allomuricauda hymeniacidonis]TAI47477.1 AraC family transcriptional regulator [Allomuricauda hymeniacidonis]